MTEPWRYACPEGHVTVRKNVGDKPGSDGVNEWYCHTCKVGYNNIRDKKTDEWVTA